MTLEYLEYGIRVNVLGVILQEFMELLFHKLYRLISLFLTFLVLFALNLSLVVIDFI